MAGEYELDRVVRERHFAEVTSGVLIEVGAAGPNYLSIGETFRAAGWQRVKVRTLDTILATHRPDLEAVDLLVVDVEGWELNVMRGFSSERYRPKVVVLENLFDEQAYIQYMRSIGYERTLQLGPNDIYARDTHIRNNLDAA